MKERMKFIGKVTPEGILEIDRNAFKLGLSEFSGKEVTVTVERVRHFRSQSQNSYYWSVVLPTVVNGLIEAGYDIDQDDKETLQAIHELLKDNFVKNEIEVKSREGTPLILPSSTSRLSSSEFAHYLERVAQWTSENLNCVIPQPTHPPGYFPDTNPSSGV